MRTRSIAVVLKEAVVVAALQEAFVASAVKAVGPAGRAPGHRSHAPHAMLLLCPQSLELVCESLSLSSYRSGGARNMMPDLRASDLRARFDSEIAGVATGARGASIAQRSMSASVGVASTAVVAGGVTVLELGSVSCRMYGAVGAGCAHAGGTGLCYCVSRVHASASGVHVCTGNDLVSRVEHALLVAGTAAAAAAAAAAGAAAAAAAAAAATGAAAAAAAGAAAAAAPAHSVGLPRIISSGVGSRSHRLSSTALGEDGLVRCARCDGAALVHVFVSDIAVSLDSMTGTDIACVRIGSVYAAPARAGAHGGSPYRVLGSRLVISLSARHDDGEPAVMSPCVEGDAPLPETLRPEHMTAFTCAKLSAELDLASAVGDIVLAASGMELFWSARLFHVLGRAGSRMIRNGFSCLGAYERARGSSWVPYLPPETPRRPRVPPHMRSLDSLFGAARGAYPDVGALYTRRLMASVKDIRTAFPFYNPTCGVASMRQHTFTTEAVDTAVNFATGDFVFRVFGIDCVEDHDNVYRPLSAAGEMTPDRCGLQPYLISPCFAVEQSPLSMADVQAKIVDIYSAGASHRVRVYLCVRSALRVRSYPRRSRFLAL